MRILIVGAGGVGAPFGVALSKGGHDVCFVARGAHLAAMRDKGLTVTGARGETTLSNLTVTDDPATLGLVDAVLLAVKLWDLEAAARSIAPIVTEDTVVLPLQNGVDAADVVKAVLPVGHVAMGACLVNGGVIAPGIIRQFSANQIITAGVTKGQPMAPLNRLAEACRASEIEFKISDDARAMLWEKFIQMVPISAVTAVTRKTIGPIREDPDCWGFFLQVLEETVAVGRALGVSISQQAIDKRVTYIKSMPPDVNASMAKDLIQGRRLELPWLSGRVSELGRSLGVPTPANDFTTMALKLHVMGAPAA